MNIVTKSGSNDYRGMVSGYVDSRQVGGQQHAQRAFSLSRSTTTSRRRSSWAVAIKRDRLWFYGILPTSRQSTTGVGVDPSLERAGGKNYKPFVKVTARVFETGNLAVGWNNNMFCCARDRQPHRAAHLPDGRARAQSRASTASTPSRSATRRLLEVRGGGIYIRDNFTPYSDDFETPGRSDQGTGFTSVNGQTASKQFHNRTTLDASLARSTSLGFGTGTHDFKAGVQTALRDAAHRAGSHRRRQLHRSERGALPRHLQRRRRPPAAVMRSVGVYLQDTWTFNDRLTLNLGVRMDDTRGDIPGPHVRRRHRGHQGGKTFSPPVASYPGVADLVSFTTFAPRVGFTVRLDNAGHTVFKSAYGRFYGKLVTADVLPASRRAAP